MRTLLSKSFTHFRSCFGETA